MRIAGRYEVISKLGEGGMGVVYLVEDTMNDRRRIALKTLKSAGRGQDALEHFKYEFSLLAGLRHPNIEEVYDFGQLPDTDDCFFTCEFVDGPDLLAATEVMRLPELTDVIVQICRGLQFLHSRGIVHNDIKPANMILTRSEPGKPLAKIIDLGIAQRRHADQSARKSGTVHYMAPEVINGDLPDGRTDLYSLGIALFQVVARALPYDGPNVGAVLRQHLTAHVPSLPKGQISTPGMDRIVRRLLEKDPEDRFQSANHVIMAINRETNSDFAFEPVDVRRRQMQTLMGSFVGRQAELDIFKLAFEQRCLGRSGVANCAPRFIRISGATGIGKTRLSKEFKNHVQLSHANFIRANCIEGQTRSFATAGQLLRSAREVFPEKLGLDADSWEIGRTPSKADANSSTTPPDRLAMIDKAGEVLLRASDLSPLVVHIEDLQWIDEDSLEFVQHLLRKIRALDEDAVEVEDPGGAKPPRLLVSATFSIDQPLDERRKAMFEALSSFEGFQEIKLEPLSDADVRRLIDQGTGGAEIPERLLKDILRCCRGIPLLVEQALATIAEKDIEVMPNGRWVLPLELLGLSISETSVSETFTRRIAGSSDDSLRVLQVLALMNQPAGVILLAKVGEMGAANVLSAISELQRTGMVASERSGEADAYFLAHGNLRPAILQTLTDEQTKTMHERIGIVLEEMSRTGKAVSQQQLAFHFLRSADTERAMEYGMKAAKEAVSRSSFPAAVDILDRCIPLAQQEASGAEPLKAARERLAGMLLKRGEAHRLNRSSARAIVDLNAAGNIFLSLDDKTKQATCLLGVGGAHQILGQHDAVRDFAVQALKLAIEANDHKNMARALLLDGFCDVSVHRQFDEAERKFLKALQLQEDIGNDDEVSVTLNYLGTLYSEQGRFDDAIRVLVRSFRLTRRLKNQTVVHSISRLGSIFWEMENRKKSIRYFKYALGVATQIGALSAIANIIRRLGVAFFHQGDLKQATVHIEQSLRLYRLGDQIDQEGECLCALAQLYCDACMYGKSLKAARTALKTVKTDFARMSAKCAFAYVLLNLGASHQAITVLGEMEAKGSKESVGDQAHPELHRLQAYCYFELGECEQAVTVLQQAIDVLRKNGNKAEEVRQQILLTNVHIERKDLAAAERHLAAAEELAAELNLNDLNDVTAKAKAELSLAKGIVSRELLLGIPEKIRLLEDSERLNELCDTAYLAARLCAAVGDMPMAVKYCRKATDTLKQMCAQVPPEYLEGFMNVSSRRRAMEEIRAIMRKAVGENTAH